MNTAKPSKTPKASGYWYALVGFGLGSLESVAFNVLAAFIGPTGYGFELWQSLLPALLGAAVWPIALLVSVEVLARVEWEAHWGWWFVRVGGILLVALASAVISYGHIHAVLKFWKYGWLEAGVGPLVIDGQMLISGFALYTIGRAARVVLPASQEATADPLPAPAHTPNVPARPVPPVGQEPAVSVTPHTPDPVTETAPQEASSPSPEEASQEGRSGLRLVPSRRLPSNPRTSSRRTSPKASRNGVLTDEEVYEAIHSYSQEHDGHLPTANWLKKNLSIGAARAKDLLSERQNDEQEVTA